MGRKFISFISSIISMLLFASVMIFGVIIYNDLEGINLDTIGADSRNYRFSNNSI
ncbi:MAG: hypothetical protein HUJ68_09310 [Clostridia bacterium]|nr:hypothetical protein [Clostridia bacterium]